jgi:hypothetical protein
MKMNDRWALGVARRRMKNSSISRWLNTGLDVEPIDPATSRAYASGLSAYSMRSSSRFSEFFHGGSLSITCSHSVRPSRMHALHMFSTRAVANTGVPSANLSLNIRPKKPSS